MHGLGRQPVAISATRVTMPTITPTTLLPSCLLLYAALTLDPEGESGSPGGVVAAVVVIVFLIVVILSLIGVLGFFFMRRKSSVKKDEPDGLTLGMLIIAIPCPE